MKETIYRIDYVVMMLIFTFGSTLDLLVLWSYFKLDKKLSSQMQERVTETLFLHLDTDSLLLQRSRQERAQRELDEM